MREITTEIIIETVRDMCIEACHFLTEDMKQALNDSCEAEKSPLGKEILGLLKKNLGIAGEEMIPICQDTGVACVFLEIGQDVHINGNAR